MFVLWWFFFFNIIIHSRDDLWISIEYRVLLSGESGKNYSVGVKAYGQDHIFYCDAPNHPTTSRSKTFTCNFSPAVAQQNLEYIIIKTKNDESISFEEVHISRHKCKSSLDVDPQNINGNIWQVIIVECPMVWGTEQPDTCLTAMLDTSAIEDL